MKLFNVIKTRSLIMCFTLLIFSVMTATAEINVSVIEEGDQNDWDYIMDIQRRIQVDLSSIDSDSGNGIATVMLPFKAEIPYGYQAFKCVSVENDILNIEELDQIPSASPVLITGPVSTVSFEGKASIDYEEHYFGILTARYLATDVIDSFTLTNENGTTDFVKESLKSVKPCEAWISLSDCEKILLPLHAGIDEIVMGEENEILKFYNLLGQEMDKDNLKPGIYVTSNGKKIIITKY